MISFDRHLDTAYVEDMRHFLKLTKYQFLLKFGFVTVDYDESGCLSEYLIDAIHRVENAFNDKAKLAEQSVTIGQRIGLALSYFRENIAESARRLSVTTDVLNSWLDLLSTPTQLEKENIAKALNIPLTWLETGDPIYLPANSPLGVRVGQEVLNNRQILRAMTMSILNELYREKIESSNAQAFIDRMVFNTEDIAQFARKSGGRWTLCTPKYTNVVNFKFSPWSVLTC